MILNYFQPLKKRMKRQETVPSYFVYEWNDNVPHVSFGTTPVGTIIGVVKMKKEPWCDEKNIELKLCCMEKRSTLKQGSSASASLLVPLLKSNLQKSVRRRNTNVALKTAKELLLIDPCSLLRRLPIIMVEDVGIHPSLAVLVWLMAAVSKGFSLTLQEETYILQVIKWMCDTKIQIPFDYRNNVQFSSWDTLSEDRKNLFCALFVRLNYGGTEGDMKMIKYWMEHIRERHYFNDSLGNDVSQLDLRFNYETDILPGAVDFHIYPSMLKQLHAKHKGFSVEEIRLAIWFCSSGVNFRDGAVIPNATNEHTQLYKQIEPDLLPAQKLFLRFLNQERASKLL